MPCCQDGCNISVLHHNKMHDVPDVGLTADKPTLPFSPVTNLNQLGRLKVSRWDVAQSPVVIDIVPTSPILIDYVGAMQTNLSPTGTIVITLWNSGVLLHSVTINPAVIPIGLFNISVQDWLEKYVGDSIIDDCTPILLCDNIKIEINDAANPTGYMQLGRAIFGEMSCYPAQENMKLSRDRNTAAEGGSCKLTSGYAHINQSRLAGREVKVSFDKANADVRARLGLSWLLYFNEPWIIKAGLSSEAESINNENTVYGMPSLGEITHITYDKYSLELTINEV